MISLKITYFSLNLLLFYLIQQVSSSIWFPSSLSPQYINLNIVLFYLYLLLILLNLVVCLTLPILIHKYSQEHDRLILQFSNSYTQNQSTYQNPFHHKQLKHHHRTLKTRTPHFNNFQSNYKEKQNIKNLEDKNQQAKPANPNKFTNSDPKNKTLSYRSSASRTSKFFTHVLNFYIFGKISTKPSDKIWEIERLPIIKNSQWPDSDNPTLAAIAINFCFISLTVSSWLFLSTIFLWQYFILVKPRLEKFSKLKILETPVSNSLLGQNFLHDLQFSDTKLNLILSLQFICLFLSVYLLIIRPKYLKRSSRTSQLTIRKMSESTYASHTGMISQDMANQMSQPLKQVFQPKMASDSWKFIRFLQNFWFVASSSQDFEDLEEISNTGCIISK